MCCWSVDQPKSVINLEFWKRLRGASGLRRSFWSLQSRAFAKSAPSRGEEPASHGMDAGLSWFFLLQCVAFLSFSWISMKIQWICSLIFYIAFICLRIAFVAHCAGGALPRPGQDQDSFDSLLLWFWLFFARSGFGKRATGFAWSSLSVA